MLLLLSLTNLYINFMTQDASNVGVRMGISSALLLLIFCLDLNTTVIYSTSIFEQKTARTATEH